MSFIKPSRPQYDPSQDLRSSGTFLCVCTGIHDVGPDPKYPESKDRLAIEFTVHAPGKPQIHGKKTASIIGKSIYRDAKTGKESNLLKLGRMMGITSPERGFDPDAFLDRWYHVQTEISNGKAYPHVVMPASPPSNASGPPLPTAPVDEPDESGVSHDQIPF